MSQLTAGLNRKREDAKNRTVIFSVYDFLVLANRGLGGTDYKNLHDALERLAGTRIHTDIRTGGERILEGFGIIDSWRIVDRSKKDGRMISVEVTLSKWFYNAVQAFEVLTIHGNYFWLRKPLEKRVYELVRKHCGNKKSWKISISNLLDKSGSKSSLKEFKRMLKKIIEDGTIPEFKLSLIDNIVYCEKIFNIDAIDNE